MKDEVLVELARRWERDAAEPGVEDGSPGAEVNNAKSQGMRETKRECADTLRTLVLILGETQLACSLN